MMAKTKKRVLALLLTLIMALSLMPVTAMAETMPDCPDTAEDSVLPVRFYLDLDGGTGTDYDFEDTWGILSSELSGGHVYICSAEGTEGLLPADLTDHSAISTWLSDNSIDASGVSVSSVKATLQSLVDESAVTVDTLAFGDWTVGDVLAASDDLFEVAYTQATNNCDGLSTWKAGNWVSPEGTDYNAFQNSYHVNLCLRLKAADPGTSFKVTKNWADSNNALGVRPASVTVQLYWNGRPDGTSTEADQSLGTYYQAVLSPANDWTYTFEGLPAGYGYAAQEVSVPGYYVENTAPYDGQNAVMEVHYDDVVNSCNNQTFDFTVPQFIVVKANSDDTSTGQTFYIWTMTEITDPAVKEALVLDIGVNLKAGFNGITYIDGGTGNNVTFVCGDGANVGGVTLHAGTDGEFHLAFDNKPAWEKFAYGSYDYTQPAGPGAVITNTVQTTSLSVSKQFVFPEEATTDAQKQQAREAFSISVGGRTLTTSNADGYDAGSDTYTWELTLPADTYYVGENVGNHGFGQVLSSYHLNDGEQTAYTQAVAVSGADGESNLIAFKNIYGSAYTETTYGSFDLIKRDTDTGAALAGVKFGLSDSEENPVTFTESAGMYTYSASGTVTDLITNSNGLIFVRELPVGTYTLQEVEGLSNYDENTSSYTVTVSENGTAAAPDTVVKDSNGLIESITHWVKATVSVLSTVPAGEAAEGAYIVNNTHEKASLEVTKTFAGLTEEQMQALENKTTDAFYIQLSDGTYTPNFTYSPLEKIFTYSYEQTASTVNQLKLAQAVRTTNYVDGDASKGIASFTYTWTINGLPTGYAYQATEYNYDVITNYSVTVAPAGGTAAMDENLTTASTGDAIVTLALTNTYTRDSGALKITKTFLGLDMAQISQLDTFQIQVKDAAGASYGSALTLTGMTPVITYVKDGDGHDTSEIESVQYSWTLTNVPTGTYSAVESGYEPGSKLPTLYCTTDSSSATVSNIQVTKGGTSAEADFSNAYGIRGTGSVIITKVDALGLDDNQQTILLAGAKFGLYDSDQELVGGIKTTDSTGKVSFTGLTAGTYTIRETQAPAGYMNTQMTYLVTVEVNDGIATTTVIDMYENEVTDDNEDPAIAAITVLNYREFGLLEVSKTFTGLTDDQIATLTENFTITAVCSIPNTEALTLHLTDAQAVKNGSTYTWEMLVPTGEWTFSESNYQYSVGYIGFSRSAYTDNDEADGSQTNDQKVTVDAWTPPPPMTPSAEELIAESRIASMAIENIYTDNTPYNPPDDPPYDPPEDIPDDPTPLIEVPEVPEEPTEIGEEEVPLIADPTGHTGDSLVQWILAAGASGIGLIWLAISGKKRREDNAE